MPRTVRPTRKGTPRQAADARITEYVREGAALDRIYGEAPESEKSTARDMGRMHNAQFNPTKSQKYR